MELFSLLLAFEASLLPIFCQLYIRCSLIILTESAQNKARYFQPSAHSIRIAKLNAKLLIHISSVILPVSFKTIKILVYLTVHGYEKPIVYFENRFTSILAYITAKFHGER